MQKLIDKLVLLGLSLLALSLSEIKWLSIVVLLVAIAISSLSSYFENRLPRVLLLFYVIFCFFFPEFTLFLPLIVYDMVGMDRRLFKFFWCFALPFCFASLGFRMGMVVSLACGVAFLLDLRTCAGQKIKDAYYALTDEAKEKAVFLERENRELLGKHDYEIQLATLAERNRIAREIHDNVGHLLTRSLLQIDALKIKIDSQGESPNISSNSDLDLVRQTLSEAMDSIRLSVHDMHDESINLKLQLEAIIKGFNFCPVKLCYDAGELPIGLRTAFAAIVREALSNIARHSKANQAMVTITEHPAFYQLIICDNGTAEVTRASGGIGLYNMADRVNALGGVFRIEDTAGFKIFISVPKEI